MMSLKSPELRIKDEPCDFQPAQTSIPIKCEPETAQSDYMVISVKEEWENVEHDVCEVSRTESALTDHKDLKVHSGFIDHVVHGGLVDHVVHSGLVDHVVHSGLADHVVHSGLVDHVVHSGLADHVVHSGLVDHVVHSGLGDHVVHSGVSEDVGLFIKQEVKVEIEVGPEVFQRPKVSIIKELLLCDSNPETPDASRNRIHLDHQKKHVEQRSHNKGSRQPNKKIELVHQNTPVEENWYKCGYCHYMTQYKVSYTKHQKQHIVANRLKNLQNKRKQLTEQATEIKSVNNQNCEPVLKDENPEEFFKCTLEHRISLECLESKEKPFKCKYCSYSCDLKSALESHERKHVSERLFKCTHCNYSFAFESDLIQHEAMHGTELLECTVCSYTCTNRNIFKRHKCDYCDYASRYENIMTVHERGHSGIQPLQCFHCNYIARNMERLQKHLEIIHNSCKSYTCKHCSYSSLRNNNVDGHLRRCARNVFKHILLEHDYCKNQGSEVK